MQQSYEKPLISILMAIYNPNISWLQAQLRSLNNQTYSHLELQIVDDYSDENIYKSICENVKLCINNIPYTLMRNKINKGSNKSFEYLTLKAKGEYIAYCDQDDIWEDDKLDCLYTLIKEKDAVLVCSDVKIIDENEKLKYESITQIRKRHVFMHGLGLTESLLVRNFVIGCTILMRSEVAKNAIPFNPFMVHDHWLALYASTRGAIEIYDKPLVRYRLHHNNQTLVLSNVNSKADYIQARIRTNEKRLMWIKQNGLLQNSERLEELLRWNKSRMHYATGDYSYAVCLWRWRHCNYTTTLFELLVMPLPEPFIRIGLYLIKRGNI